MLRVHWTAVDAASDEAQPVNPDVVAAVAEVLAARGRRDAVVFNRDGRFDDAAALLKEAAASILRIAPENAAVAAVAATLEREVVDYSEQLSVSQLKARHFVTYNATRGRDAKGKARGKRG